MTGDDTRALARQQREVASRLIASAEHHERRADAKDPVGAVLARLPFGWMVFQDLAWPGRRRARIDHVALGPTGLFVIDSKQWASGSGVDELFLPLPCDATSPGRLDSSLIAADAVAGLSACLDRAWITPVVCLSQSVPARATPSGVTICSTTSLVNELTARPALLGPHDLGAAAAALVAGARRMKRSSHRGLRSKPSPAL